MLRPLALPLARALAPALAAALAPGCAARRGALPPAAHARALAAAATKGYSVEDGSPDDADADAPFEVELRPMEAHRLEGGPPPPARATTTRAQLTAAYESMYRMRRCEVAADMLYKSNAVRGFLHLADGQARARGAARRCGGEDAAPALPPARCAGAGVSSSLPSVLDAPLPAHARARSLAGGGGGGHGGGHEPARRADPVVPGPPAVPGARRQRDRGACVQGQRPRQHLQASQPSGAASAAARAPGRPGQPLPSPSSAPHHPPS